MVTIRIPAAMLHEGSNNIRISFGRDRTGKRIAFVNHQQLDDDAIDFGEGEL